MSKLERYDSYKDSGVEWLGEIPSEWEVKKLKFLTKDILGGGTPSSSTTEYWTDNINNSYLWVSIADITKSEFIKNTKKYITNSGLRNCSAKIVPPYSILYSIYASLGKVAYSDKILTTNQAILSIIFKDKYYYKFMFYYLKTLTQVAIHLSNSTTQDNISLDILKNLTCSIPPLQEQQKIASFLDTKTEQLDKAITQKEQLIELLKERRQILINDAVTKGIDKTVTMKDSGVEWIGNIPKHWEVKKVKNIFNLIINPAPNNNNEELLSIYTDIGVKPRRELAEKGNKASTTDGYWIVRKGDFIVNKLLAWMGAIGLSNYNGVTSPAYDILRAKIDTVGIYYHELFRLKVFSQEMKKHSRGIMDMRLRLYFDKFGDIRVPYPEKKEQQLIVNYIEENNQKINKAIDLQEQQIAKLKEYKTTLIDSVVTGKVRVCDD